MFPNPAFDSLTNQANTVAYAIQRGLDQHSIEARMDQLIRYWRCQKVQP